MNNTFSFFTSKSKGLIKLTDLVSGRIYFKNHYIDLIDKKTYKFSVECFYSKLKTPIVFNQKRIIHLFYELDFTNLQNVNDDQILAIDLSYSRIENVNSDSKKLKIELLKKSYPDFESYKKRFDRVQYHLNRGDCYQVNLTERFVFETSNNLEDFSTAFINNNQKSEFAHLSYIEYLNKAYFSNSPESLFNIEDNTENFTISSRPIKGTISRGDEEDIDELWEKLTSSLKDQAELYMISDLIRNDLAGIEKPNASIVKAKERLIVPGLIHQYSLLEAKLSKTVTLYSILCALFPGGSITGAPKIRVREIIKSLEEEIRSFYCSSTIFFEEDSLRASINIRSAEINFNNGELIYGSGGGVTLMSSAEDEFHELLEKLESFLKLFV